VKIGIFSVKEWEREYLNRELDKLFNIEVVYLAGSLGDNNLPEQNDFDGLSVFVGSKISKKVIDYFPNLKFITTRSTGFDHIDIDYCREKGILVSSVPDYGDNTVAEFAFALLLDLSRKIYESYDKLREEGDWSLESLQGFDLKGKTIGVVGTGRIGLNSIKIAGGFSMNVLAYDAFPKKELETEYNFKYVELNELIKQSDVITLHVPYLESTHHLINDERISMMKQNAVLINTSRGSVVDTFALLQAVKNKRIAGAGLDVLEEENAMREEFDFLLKGEKGQIDWRRVLANQLLIDLPNVIVTPHNAFNTKEALQRILDTTILNIKGFVSEEPVNLVK